MVRCMSEPSVGRVDGRVCVYEWMNERMMDRESRW